ncbi:hypothetical protein Dimus_021645 [Dionaea muscipula]
MSEEKLRVEDPEGQIHWRRFGEREAVILKQQGEVGQLLIIVMEGETTKEEDMGREEGEGEDDDEEEEVSLTPFPSPQRVITFSSRPFT